MKLPAMIAVLIAAAAVGSSSHAQAPKPNASRSAPTTAAPPTPQADPPAQPGWAARCTSANRGAPLECAIEQTAVLSKTGQLVVLVNIRVPSDTHAPAGRFTDVQIQTCEARGCYASLPIAPDLLATLRSGKQLKVSFQNIGKETITIPMPLADYASAYDKIK